VAYAAWYEIQVSDDAVEWTTVYTEADGDGGIDDIDIPAVQARYVRMLGIQRGTPWGYSLWEFEVNAGPPPVVCSSVEGSGLECEKAVDKDLTTRWSSAYTDDEWIYVDLGSQQTVNRVTLHWEVAYAAWYEIQVSDDAVNWTTVYTESAGDGGIDDIDIPAVQARYVRMQGIQRGTPWGYSLWEFEINGWPIGG
jgi:chondroitin AC lyase